MAKIELKGKFLFIGPVETVGDKKTPKQTVVFQVPAYVDGFGDVRGKEEMWQIDCMGDLVAKFKLTDDVLLKKAVIGVYINSALIKTKAGEDLYIINANLASVEIRN